MNSEIGETILKYLTGDLESCEPQKFKEVSLFTLREYSQIREESMIDKLKNWVYLWMYSHNKIE